MDTKKYTCIKPMPMNHQKVVIGDEVELTANQARPLQHGGFITFDEAAASCIRQLAKGEGAADTETNSQSDEQAVITDNAASIDTRNRTLSSVNFEEGD